MKIRRIEINAFGKLKNFSIDLEDGFNLVYGENENGKTTVMTFIKCMFYGTGTKKQSLKESVRERYTPWDNSTMGGRIYFSLGGVNYCLEREFRGSDATDRITLTDKDSGRLLPAGKNVGEELFSLTENAFTRSIFIDNGVSFTADSAAQSDFNSRLSSVSVSADGEAPLERIEKRLTDAKNKLLSGTGRAGSLVKDRAALQDLREKLYEAKSAEKEMSEIAGRIEEITEKAQKTKAEAEKEKKIIDSENAVKNARKIAEYIRIKKELGSLEAGLTQKDGAIVPLTFTKVVSAGLANYENLKTRVHDLKAEIEDLRKSEEETSATSAEEATERLKDIAEKEQALLSERDGKTELVRQKSDELNAVSLGTAKNGKGGIKAALCITGGVLIAAAVAAYFLLSVPYIFAVSGALGILLLIAGLFIKGSTGANNEQMANMLNSEIIALNSSISEINARISEITVTKVQLKGVIDTGFALKKQREADLEQKNGALALATEKMHKAEAEVLSYFSKWKDVSSIEETVKENEKLEEIYERRKELSTALNLYVKDLGDISVEKAESMLKTEAAGDSPAPSDFEEHKERYRELQESYSNLISEKVRLETMLSTGFADFVSPQTIARDISAAEETVRAKEDFVNAASIAIEALSESSESMRKSYGVVLESRAQEIFKKLTAGKYGMLTLDNNLEMRAEEKDFFGTKSVDYLSRGAVDQAYLSLRLALSSLLSSEESLPVMLDDALSQYDDKRLKTAVAFLSEYAKDNQTVLFTCHGNTLDEAKAYGAKIIKL